MRLGAFSLAMEWKWKWCKYAVCLSRITYDSHEDKREIVWREKEKQEHQYFLLFFNSIISHTLFNFIFYFLF